MIPRYQKILLWVLLACSVGMSAYLIRLRERAQDQLAQVENLAPMPPPVETPMVPVTLMIADDGDGSLQPVQRRLALPAEETARARVLLNDLFREYARPNSHHRLAAVQAVNDVFLLPVPGSANSAPGDASATSPGGQQLAVVNLNRAFADRHPSGVLVETLTLLSTLGTLHAAVPQIAQVRFLVDGQPRETLAGHADLTRTYLTANDDPESTAVAATTAAAWGQDAGSGGAEASQ